MDRSIDKKRKRREAEASAPAKANGTDKVSKKSSKSKKSAPEEPEEDDFEGFEEEDAEEVEDEEEDDENDNEGEDEEMNGNDLPTESAPTLPMSNADAQSFDELKLSDKTMQAIKEMGFTKMTSIQKSVRLFN